MFKKTPKRNIRRRRNDSDNEHAKPNDDDDDDLENSIGVVPIVKKKANKKSKEKTEAKSTSLLSFGDDAEEESGETFKLKKSSRSRRIAKQIKKLAQEEKERSEVVAPGTAGPGHYTKENLEKLRNDTVKAPVSMLTSEVENIQEVEHFGNESSTNSNNTPGLRPGEIPTPAAIHAARKQRELYRKYGNEYIAVDDTDRFKDNNSKSRLVRDDDNDASGSDGEEAVPMKGVIDDAEKMSHEIIEDIDSDHRDDEINRWEEQLIRTGQGFQQNAPSEQHQLESNQMNGLQHQQQFYMNSSDNSTASKFSGSPTETLMNVRKRVKERIAIMKEVNYGHERECEKIKLETEECEKTSKDLVDTKQLERHYHFFQLMHNYVRDLIDCLNEKLSDIEDVEAKVHNALSQQSQKLLERRRADIADESADANAIASGGIAATNAEKQARTREREARRKRRNALRQSYDNQFRIHRNGMSTDDQEPTSDSVKYANAFEVLQDSMDEIFEDVVDEFHNIEKILEKFNDWREKFPASYNDAYIGLCLPKILAPFIRKTLIDWNPLIPGMSLEDHFWFPPLIKYAADVKQDQRNENETVHQDERILPILYEKVIIPKLVFIITEVWDPLSSTQTHALKEQLDSICNSYPCASKNNKRFQGLIVSICAKLQHAIDNDIFIPLLPAMSLVNINSGPGAFLERQTWSSLKLFQNILLFHEILSEKSLHELAFDSILNRYIILALQTAPVTSGSIMKCQFVVTSIPEAWLKPENNNLQGHLLAMCKYLLHAANQIHAHIESSGDKTRAEDCMKQISGILYRIGEEEFSDQVDKLIWSN